MVGGGLLGARVLALLQPDDAEVVRGEVLRMTPAADGMAVGSEAVFCSRRYHRGEFEPCGVGKEAWKGECDKMAARLAGWKWNHCGDESGDVWTDA
ncbi:hypothetical protein TGAM01_v204933 [Trichoderma gamsii]|uniref:Uncharacterized protein n=1 Tax=Trichoderma gamsii TaxID=398673 RepID=A0A2P4ZNW7_9HYPO|nr:hypothetical protein TGAM01_v204933 [Trichoderma gamsii]PON25989.1 hypothetical protein TGAM01_v204933 [Trichoderma gamsii]